MTAAVVSFQTATEMDKQWSTHDGRDVTANHCSSAKTEGMLENRLNDAIARPYHCRRSNKFAAAGNSSSTIWASPHCNSITAALRY